MKKYLSYVIIFLISFICISNIKAENINSIKMDVYVDSNGDAYVEEVWDVDATEKTEYYHAYYNIGDSSISDLTVRDEDHEYTYIDWDTNGDLSDKAYHYGYNYDYDGVELCFGKSSYNHHTYTLTYKINGFVYNTSDGKQVMYWTMLNKINPAPEKYEIVIRADEAFSDYLDVWGYGFYGGESSVSEGKIYLTNQATDEVFTSSDYVAFLAKFEEPIFNTNYDIGYSFDEIMDMAEEGSTSYTDNSSTFDTILSIFVFIFNALIWFFIILAIVKTADSPTNGSKKLKFGDTGNKVPKDTPMFRDLPCNKDIFRAYWVATNYNLVKKKTDFLGAMILKWLKAGIVKVESETKGAIFKKEETKIVMSEATFDIEVEQKLYDYMKASSKDGVLENKEFEKWCSLNYSKILKWFDNVLDYETDKLVSEGKIIEEEKTSLGVFKSKVYNVDSSMMEEAKQMKGLKEFFNEFDNMSDKEAIEVYLWEEYLMYAQIFGVAEKVAKQFKKLYPDVITDYNYDSIIYINSFSHAGVASANTAYSRAQSYSSGGGGFSSGGGGGGSFGGGGGSFGGGSR